jgi:hypothetical protein
MSEEVLTESSCTATINAPIEFVDIPTWLFTLPDAEYQRCSPAHIAAAATTTDDGRRMSINVETIGGELMVQHYVEDIGEKHHCRVLSTSDLLTPAGWTTTKVLWELSVKAIDAETCELTNHVIGSTTPELLKALGKRGVPLEMAKASRGNATTAHNAQETPFFAKSIEKKALEAKASARKMQGVLTVKRSIA